MSVLSLPRRVLSERMARGALINLVGAVTYGLSGFVFITLLAREIGPVGAGTFWLALAAFNIISRSCELGAVSGFVKLIARHRSAGDLDRIAPSIVAGLIPVIVAALLAMNLLDWFAPIFAGFVSADGAESDVGEVIGALALFLPVNSVYWVITQGMRGFGTMLPTVLIDRIGRAVLQPVAVLWVLGTGGTLAAAATAWGAVVVVLLVISMATMVTKLRRLLAAEGLPLRIGDAKPADDVVREFWGFTLPRAGGQVFEVMILWVDVLLVGVPGVGRRCGRLRSGEPLCADRDVRRGGDHAGGRRPDRRAAHSRRQGRGVKDARPGRHGADSTRVADLCRRGGERTGAHGPVR